MAFAAGLVTKEHGERLIKGLPGTPLPDVIAQIRTFDEVQPDRDASAGGGEKIVEDYDPDRTLLEANAVRVERILSNHRAATGRSPKPASKAATPSAQPAAEGDRKAATILANHRAVTGATKPGCA